MENSLTERPVANMLQYSIDGTTTDNNTQIYSCQNSKMSDNDFMNLLLDNDGALFHESNGQIIELQNIIIETFEKDGEKKPRIVLVSADGTTYGGAGVTLFNAMKKLYTFLRNRQGGWVDPVPVQIVVKQSNKDKSKSVHTVRVLSPEEFEKSKKANK